MSGLNTHIEAIIFIAEQPINTKEIQNCLTESLSTHISLHEIQTAIEDIIQKYQSDDFPFEIVEISEGYQFLTKPAYQHTLHTLLKHKSKKRLSTAALETLSIVAYRQPITKADIEQIRGVNSDYAVQKLLEKELITIDGRAETLGKPLLYATSDKFMDYLGLKSLKEMPKLKEFEEVENKIGDEN
jgi:segregation and condensation protein B